MPENPITMVPLEGRLLQDEGGDVLRGLEAELQGYLRETESRLRVGLTPAEYEQAEKMRVAWDAALRVVRGFWIAQHGRDQNRGPSKAVRQG